MKYQVKDLTTKFRTIIGDSTVDIPSEFIINALNWAFNELPRVPKLERIFSKHINYQLDAKGHYKWNLNNDKSNKQIFRRIMNLPFLGLYTSTGGKPCPLK